MCGGSGNIVCVCVYMCINTLSCVALLGHPERGTAQRPQEAEVHGGTEFNCQHHLHCDFPKTPGNKAPLG